MWGASARLFKDDFGPDGLRLVPQEVWKHTVSTFVQDEMALAADRIHVTFGTKVEHGGYAGFEIEPSIRIGWTWSDRQTVWGAVSRAARTPSRLDRDLIMPPLSAGGPDFQSEEVIAYELGYRVQPHEHVSVSIASFYNDFDKIRSIESASPSAPIPLVFTNGQQGETYGAEFTAEYHSTDWWRISAGYTELRVHISPAPDSTDRSFGASEDASSQHQLALRSSMDFPMHLQVDPAFRYVSRVTNPQFPVPGYGELDLRLAWLSSGRLTLSLVGQNLLHRRHAEFGSVTTRQDISRSVYVSATHRW
jgi:iron complex outermembrane receptor protein